MNTQTPTTDTTDAQTDDRTADKQLRYELRVEFSRDLDHAKDDPGALRDLLKRRSIYTNGLGVNVPKDDLVVCVGAFEPENRRAVVRVGADRVGNRPPLPDHFASSIRSGVRRGYKEATQGKEKPQYNRLAKMRALRGEAKKRGTSKKRREKAERWAERHELSDFEDAPTLGLDVTVRTLEGHRPGDRDG